MRYVYGVLVLGLLMGCTESVSQKPLNGEKLIEQKCSICHNLDMPPKSYTNEIAPSMMAVTFHLKDFIKSNNPSEHEGKVVAFIKDYVISPSRKKSFCDEDSLDSYGLMPSQKGKVSNHELDAIAHYMYQTFDNQELLRIMAEEGRLARLLVHERVLEQQKCENCHDTHNDKVAPSFDMISSRYDTKDRETLIKSVKEGTKGKWEGKKLPMPAFKNMSDTDVEGIVNWILSLKNLDKNLEK
jgi:cytochrome c